MRLSRLDSRWARWLPWVRRHQLQGNRGSDVEYRALHKQRVTRILAARVGWPAIVRWDLDDPRHDDVHFATMLEWAVRMKPARPRAKWDESKRRVSA
jgi:hypothetical protein